MVVAAMAVALLRMKGARAHADYPDKPVQLIAQQPPGSLSETMKSWTDRDTAVFRPIINQLGLTE